MPPPFILLGRVLLKIIENKVESVVIIAPIWSAQTWFPLLLCNLLEQPINSRSVSQLVIQDRLLLATWKVSGIPAHTVHFQRTLLSCCVQPGGKELKILLLSMEEMV